MSGTVSSQAESAYSQLRQLLLSGAYQPGQQVAEVALSVRLEMSRTPIREALRRLESDGLIARSWRGVMVPALGRVEIGHAYEMRAALEALTGELAARRVRDGNISRRELDVLREHAGRAEFDTSRGDLGAAVESNRGFHRMIATMAANPLVLGALDRLWDRVIISTRLSLTPRERPLEVAQEHERLIVAIETGRPEEASAIARAHVLTTQAALAPESFLPGQ